MRLRPPRRPGRALEAHSGPPALLDPYLRLIVMLAGSVVLWTPTLRGLLRGAVDPLTASVRFVIAFVLVSGAVVAFDRLVGGYAARADERLKAEAERPTDHDPDR